MQYVINNFVYITNIVYHANGIDVLHYNTYFFVIVHIFLDIFVYKYNSAARNIDIYMRLGAYNL